MNEKTTLSKIAIVELEVHYCVGVTEEERAKPQRLLLTVDMSFDFSAASLGDRLEKTIDYYAVSQGLLKFGEGRSWKLLEKLVANIADWILAEFRPEAVMVEARKFIIPEARYVSVTQAKTRGK